MFNTTRVPVKVYRWDDEGAPQVKNGKGAIKTILKACLNAGYGESDKRKEPLGWDILFEEAQKACFRSRHPQANGWALGVDDSLFERSATCGADVFLLKEPSSAVTGKTVRAPERQGFAYAARWKGEMGLKWVLVGHARAFCLSILTEELSVQAPMLYFGEFPSLAIADENNTILSTVVSRNYNCLDDGSNSLLYKVAADYKGDSVKSTAYSKGEKQTGVSYPNPITNGFSADDIYIYDYVSDKVALRGFMPGVLHTMEQMPDAADFPYGTIYDNLDGTGDRYMYMRRNGGLGCLINLTAWDI